MPELFGFECQIEERFKRLLEERQRPFDESADTYSKNGGDCVFEASRCPMEYSSHSDHHCMQVCHPKSGEGPGMMRSILTFPPGISPGTIFHLLHNTRTRNAWDETTEVAEIRREGQGFWVTTMFVPGVMFVSPRFS